MRVSQKKLDRLWEHLLELEKKTGSHLRTESRYKRNDWTHTDCPIACFAPDCDADKYKYDGSRAQGVVVYKRICGEKRR